MFAFPQQAVATALKSFGRLDGLVLNAGVIEPLRKIGDIDSMDEVQQLINVNVTSIFSSLRHSVKHLRETKGRVVMVSSGAATKAYGAWSPYWLVLHQIVFRSESNSSPSVLFTVPQRQP